MNNSPDDPINLLPVYYYNSLAKAIPDEFEQNVRFNLNIDEIETMEVLTAFSYYEALSPKERIEAKKGIAELQISDLLTFIGQNNEILLDRIELLFDKGIPVLAWLTNQLNRGKAMIITFDQLILEGKKYEQQPDKSERIQ